VTGRDRVRGCVNRANRPGKVNQIRRRGPLPVFPSNVKARHERMVGLFETMLKLHKDLPKSKTPHVRANG
jgi:hypothetical protein